MHLPCHLSHSGGVEATNRRYPKDLRRAHRGLKPLDQTVDANPETDHGHYRTGVVVDEEPGQEQGAADDREQLRVLPPGVLNRGQTRIGWERRGACSRVDPGTKCLRTGACRCDGRHWRHWRLSECRRRQRRQHNDRETEGEDSHEGVLPVRRSIALGSVETAMVVYPPMGDERSVPPEQGPAARGDGGLVRAIGTFGLAAGILNITIGGGIFRLPADVGGALGAAAPLAYLVCAVAMGLIVLAFAEAGSRVSLTGGPYAYVETAFGPFAGFLCGALLWMLGTFALAAVSTIFVANVAQLAPFVGGTLGRALLLGAVFTALATVNIRGVRHGTRLNNAFTIAKLLPLVLLALLGTWAIRGEHLTVTATPAVGDVARTSILLVFAFAGIETALVPGGEVREPARTVPRAILIAMLAITGLYIWLQIVAQGVLGANLAGHPTPLAEAAGQGIGPWARTLLLAGASISMFGYIGGMTLAVPRTLYAFARDGFLPAALARVHHDFRTPHVAIVVQTTIAFAFAVTGRFEWLAIVANLATLMLYGACCMAAWTLRRRGVSQGGTPFRVPAGGVVPWLACGVILWMLTSIRASEWLALSAVLVGASLLYLRAGRRRTVRAIADA